MNNDIEIPEFTSDDECRKYLLTITLEIIQRIKREAFKKRETKDPEIIRSKNNQVKLLLESVKTCNQLIKDSQLDSFSKRLELFNKGIYTIEDNSAELYELSEEAKIELEKLNADLEVIIE